LCAKGKKPGLSEPGDKRMSLETLAWPKQALLGEAVEKLATAVQARAIILFGSRARGDQREDSDYDLCVVIPEDSAAEWSSQPSTGRLQR